MNEEYLDLNIDKSKTKEVSMNLTSFAFEGDGRKSQRGALNEIQIQTCSQNQKIQIFREDKIAMVFCCNS
jgi:hypothetical protein